MMLDFAFSIEAGAAVIFVLAVIVLGFRGERWLGAIVLGLLAILTSLLGLVGPFVGYNLGSFAGAWVGLTVGLVLAGAVVIAMYLGRLGEGWAGAAALGFLTLISSLISAIGLAAGYYLRADTGAWIGLLSGVTIAGPRCKRFFVRSVYIPIRPYVFFLKQYNRVRKISFLTTPGNEVCYCGINSRLC
jgi:hypothetical protein